MGEKTGIAWTDRTWNPHQGCTKVSDGCANCYMFREKRAYGQDPAVVVRSKPDTFNAPLKWEKKLAQTGERAKVFVCSWSDFFHAEADVWRAKEWDIIRACPHLDFQLCTKRPERILHCLPDDWGTGWPNVWVGTTVESAKYLHRLYALRAVPAAVRFVSCEPLLGPLTGLADHLKHIHWAIFACESGYAHKTGRDMDIEWVRGGLAACAAAGTAPFVKQIGMDGKVSVDPSEWPSDLRVRLFPKVTPWTKM